MTRHEPELTYEEAIGRRSGASPKRPEVDKVFHEVTDGGMGCWEVIALGIVAGVVLALFVVFR